MPLQFQDGHEGLVGTRYDFVRAILEDNRFSMRPERMPMGPSGHVSDDEDLPNAALPAELLANSTKQRSAQSGRTS